MASSSLKSTRTSASASMFPVSIRFVQPHFPASQPNDGKFSRRPAFLRDGKLSEIDSHRIERTLLSFMKVL